jgi:sterol desaturase/sphingolipid hydroxylase (fatty acid hydroxylase superfamily)
VGVVGKALLIGGIAALLWLERKHPLRVPVDPGLRRVARNVAVGALTAATVAAIERPIVTRVAAIAEHRRWGIVPRLGAPASVATAVGIALMDYTLYWWHVLLHRVPALWRMHEPHHIDRDLDMSTALRFHFAEFLASVPWRCAQVIAIGAGPRLLALWQKLTLAEVLFHHSNVRLPREIERLASSLVVTPSLHGIHHSVERRERDSNFSSGLTIWDRLHGTARFDLSREDVQIGLPGFERMEDVTLAKTLALPFEHRAAELVQTGQPSLWVRGEAPENRIS